MRAGGQIKTQFIMSTRHTPEPWHVSNHVDNNQVVVRSNDGDIIANLECDMVRDFTQGDPSEQIMADARHIVHCVNTYDELLNALREALDQLESWNTESEPTFTMRRISLTIAKAEGGGL